MRESCAAGARGSGLLLEGARGSDGTKTSVPEASAEPGGDGCKNNTETSSLAQQFRTRLSIVGVRNQTHQRTDKIPPKLGKEQSKLRSNPEVMIKPKVALTWVCE